MGQDGGKKENVKKKRAGEGANAEEGVWVDVGRAEKRVWIWKVTPSVSRAWDRAFQENQSLGTVTVAIDLLNQNKTSQNNTIEDPTIPPFMKKSGSKDKTKDNSLTNEVHKETTLDLPNYGIGIHQNYSIESLDLPSPLYIFSETNEGKVIIDGIVHKKFDAKQKFQLNQQFLHVKKQKGPKIKEWDHTSQITTTTPIIFNIPSRKASSLKVHQNKKVRMERSNLQDKLFQLFEEQPRYALNDLIVKTVQPKEFLKQIVEEICDKVKVGSKVVYQLKLEYKRSDVQNMDEGV
ncbi:uncharacterized protein LOC131027441 isoform X1 [Cryptomeria japonica]|uniref:uncharacterized protein LOC131027441 isoform X1 n=1 Tax=Cryptomeria japonica TaxID=3369 RepID=UPI0025AD2F9F|nr:uncharacterized protein LOC131027441 isoform X1 [Cryptomeria japonica]XP_057813486.1 uncharacterized protein LOC131027441 isoform X1 [Cryptomeria japonica]XP_057813487.1 uncharacterized protein LOC131027441 isoform X1 [Cryptomeria japonica]